MRTVTNIHTKAIIQKWSMLPIMAAIFFGGNPASVSAQDKVAARPEYVSSLDKTMPFTTEGISTQLLNEYNAIVKKYIYTDAKGPEKFKTGVMTSPDRNRLETIFKQMNRKQQASAKVGFFKRMEPLAKSTPTDEQFEKWKDETKYGVWIDGKKVKNEALNNYKASDFSHYAASKLAYTDKMKKDVMKTFHLKTMYSVQLDLLTHAGYTAYYNSVLAEPETGMYFRVRKDAAGKEVDIRWNIN